MKKQVQYLSTNSTPDDDPLKIEICVLRLYDFNVFL
jgi:hypothetical protein